METVISGYLKGSKIQRSKRCMPLGDIIENYVNATTHKPVA